MAGEFELKKKALKRDADTSSDDNPDASGARPAKRPPGGSPSAKDKTAKKAGGGGSSAAEHGAREADREENPPESGTEKRRGAVLSKILSKILSKKTIVYTVIALGIAVIACSIYLFISSDTVKKHFADAPPPKMEPVTSITRPIPIPDYREMLDFLVLNETEGQKTLTLFRMEIAYYSLARYKNFKEQNVIFRDTIYSFLLKQNSSRITSRSWHNVVEKELLDYIRVKLPQSHADSIKLTQVENL